MFQKLTGFIERLDSEEYGNWVIDKENDGLAPFVGLFLAE